MTDALRNAPQQARATARLQSLDDATRLAIKLVGRDSVTTGMIAELAQPRASIGTVYRYGRDRLFWLNRVQPVATHGIEAVLALHRPEDVDIAPDSMRDDSVITVCAYDDERWPCPTVIALTVEPEEQA